jgi:hypothetical protein
MDELVEHGFGEFTFTVETTKGQRIKAVLECGKHHVFFFERKEINNESLL